MVDAIEKVASIAQDILDKENATDPAIKKVMKIVESFIKTHRVMCYGGTAINNLLPKSDQFYDPEKDIPDYDFFAETPQQFAMKLADQIAQAGIDSVEVKPGMHLGTFKVFADYTGVADISFLDKPIFERLWKESIEKDSIHYVPPNFLRMSVYLELSRPRGDVSRWKKVYSRLSLLNKHYPIECTKQDSEFSDEKIPTKLKKQIEKVMIQNDVVLLGYNAYDLQKSSKQDWYLPIDLLVEPSKIEKVAGILSELIDAKYEKEYEEYGELLPKHIDIIRNKKVAIRLFETAACHSYHKSSDGVMIASIPTLLQFFLSIYYGEKAVIDSPERLICTAHTLIEMANNDKKRRFKLLTPITCVGEQKDLIDMKEEKSEMYKALLHKRNSPEFLKYFFSYNPHEITKTKKQKLIKGLRKTQRLKK